MQNHRVDLLNQGNIEKNIILVERLRAIAAEKNVTLPQLMNAWALSKDIIPLIGVSTKAQFMDSIRTKEIVLTPEDVRQIEDAVPAGEIAGNSFRSMQFKNGRVMPK